MSLENVSLFDLGLKVHRNDEEENTLAFILFPKPNSKPVVADVSNEWLENFANQAENYKDN